ncbi:MAG: serine protease, partial [Chitinophagaceae bacterium]|nr:serine protease [Chitinophagaceae bacterium]
GSAFSKTRMQEGFVITSVNGMDVSNVEEFKKAIAASEGSARLEGIYPGYDGVYTYPLNLTEQ